VGSSVTAAHLLDILSIPYDQIFAYGFTLHFPRGTDVNTKKRENNLL
jgi:hypothetical protein